MPGRHLKLHSVYMDRLLTYASACGIEVVHREYPEEGVYLPTKRRIVIDESLADSAEVATLLHELGHMMDDTLYTPAGELRDGKAYHATYHGRPTRQQKARVLACERRAWRFGQGIAKKLRIRLGRWYAAERKDALESYRRIKARK